MSPGDWFPLLRVCVFKNRHVLQLTQGRTKIPGTFLREGRKEERKKAIMVCISIALLLEQRFLLYFPEMYG